MKIVTHGVEIETDSEGNKRVKELVDIACEDDAEAKRVEGALKACLEETLQKAKEAAEERK